MNRLFVLALPCVVLGWGALGLAETPAELARFVVAQNADAHTRLRSFAYTFTLTRSETGADGKAVVTSKVTGEWKQQGLQTWARLDYHIQRPVGPFVTRPTHGVTVFLGKQSAGIFAAGTTNPNEIEYEDIANLPDAVKRTIMPHLAADPMLSAFGTGSRWLTDELEDNPPHVRWEGERCEADGALVFKLKRFISTRADAVPDLILTLDPAKGWLVTRRLWYAGRDALREETVVAAEQSTDHVWYPSRVDSVRHARAADGANATKSRTEVVVDAFKADVPFPAAQFSVAALDLPMGVQLVRTTVRGELVSLRNGGQGLTEVARRSRIASAPMFVPPPPPPATSDSMGTVAATARSSPDRWRMWGVVLSGTLLAIGVAAALGLYYRRKRLRG